MSDRTSNIQIIFTAVDKGVQKVLSELQTASKRAAAGMTDMVERTKEQVRHAGRQGQLLRDTSKEYKQYADSVGRSTKVTDALTQRLPYLSKGMEGNRVAAEALIRSMTGLTKAEELLQKGRKDGVDFYEFRAGEDVLMALDKRVRDFNRGLTATSSNLSRINRQELPSWIGGMENAQSATHRNALAQHLLAGNITTSAEGLKFANEQVMQSVGLNTEQAEVLRRSNLNWSEHNKLIDSNNKSVHGYDNALKTLTTRYGRSNAQVQNWGKTLTKATRSIENLRRGSEGVSPALRNMAGQMNIAKVAIGAMEGNISLTGDRLKFLNQVGLDTVGMNQKVASSLGVLDKNFNAYERGLHRVTRTSKESVSVYRSLASVYNQNSQVLDKVAKATLDADRVTNQAAMGYQKLAETAKKGGIEQEYFANRAKNVVSEQNRLKVATGLMTGQYRVQGNELVRVSDTLSNHRKVLNEVTGLYRKGSQPIKDYVQGLRRLGVEKKNATEQAAKTRKEFARTVDALHRTRDYYPEYAKNLRAVNIHEAIRAGHLRVSNGLIEINNDLGRKAFGITRQQAESAGLLNKSYSSMERVVQNVARQNASHGKIVRDVADQYGYSEKNAKSLNTAWQQTLSTSENLIRTHENQKTQNQAMGKSYADAEKNIRKFSSEQFLSEELTRRYSSEINKAGLGVSAYAQHVEKAAQKMRLSAPMKEAYARGLTSVGVTSVQTGQRVEILAKNFDKVYKAFYQTGVQSGFTERQMHKVMNTTGELSKVTRGLGDTYRVQAGRVQALDKSTGRWLKTQLEFDRTGRARIRTTDELAGSYTTLGKQIGSVHGALNRVYAALRVTASYMVAGTAVYALINTFRQAQQAIFNFDQALKNLQAITMATSGEVRVMEAVMKRVASTTKFSASEIGDAMVYIGQAGFTAAESVQTIQAVANLATGTLASLTEAGNLLTTTLRVFNLDASESARVSDVLANAVNKSKTSVDKLNVTMNYLGPVAHSAGMSIEETASAIMVLSNAGIRASTVGTGFRQVISRLLSPTARLQTAIREAGFTVEDFNIQIQNARTGNNGFLTVISNLAKVIDGDVDKAFRGFGLRGANIAVILSRLGNDMEFFVDQASEAGTAVRMAEIQMEGLVVASKNLRDKLGLLAIEFGAILRPAIKGALDVLRPFVDILTIIVSKSSVQFITALGLMSVATIGLYKATKLLIAVALYNFLGQSVRGLMMASTATGMLALSFQSLRHSMNVAAAHSFLLAGNMRMAATTMHTAATAGTTLQVVMFGLKRVVLGLFGILSAHPFIALSIAIMGVFIALNRVRQAFLKNMEANEKNMISARGLADEYKKFANNLDGVEAGTERFSRIQQRLIEQFPKLTSMIKGFEGDVDGLREALEELSEEERIKFLDQAETHFENLFIVLDKANKELEKNQKVIDHSGSAWKTFASSWKDLSDVMMSFLLKAPMRLGTFVSLYDAVGMAIKGKATSLDEANEAMAKNFVATREYAKQLGVLAYHTDVQNDIVDESGETHNTLALAIERLLKANEDLIPVAEASYRAQRKWAELIKDFGPDLENLGKGLAAAMADIPVDMADSWLSTFATLDAAGQELFISQIQAMQKYVEDVENLKEQELIGDDERDQLIRAKAQELHRNLLNDIMQYNREVIKLIEKPYEIRSQRLTEIYDREVDLINQHIANFKASTETQVSNIISAYEQMDDVVSRYYDDRRVESMQLYSAQIEFWKQQPKAYEEIVTKELIKLDKQRVADQIILYQQEYQTRKAHYDSLRSLSLNISAEQVKVTEETANQRKKLEEDLSNELIRIDERVQQEKKRNAESLIRDIEQLERKRFDIETAHLSTRRKNQAVYKKLEKDESDFRQALLEEDVIAAQKALDSIRHYYSKLEGTSIDIMSDDLREVSDPARTAAMQRPFVEREVKFRQELSELNQKQLIEESEREKQVAKELTDEKIREIQRLSSNTENHLARMAEAVSSAIEQVANEMTGLDESIENLRDIQIAFHLGELQEKLIKAQKFLKDFEEESGDILIKFFGQGSKVAPIGEKLDEILGNLENFKNTLQSLEDTPLTVSFKGEASEGSVVGLLSSISMLNEATKDFIKNINDWFDGLEVEMSFVGRSRNETLGLNEMLDLILTKLLTIKKVAEDISGSVEDVISVAFDPEDQKNLIEAQELHKTMSVGTTHTKSSHSIVVDGLSLLKEILVYHATLDKKHTKSTHTIEVKNVEPKSHGGVVGAVKRFSFGGLVPGRGNTDSVPMKLPEGSYVLRKSAVRRYGKDFLDKLRVKETSGLRQFRSSINALLTPQEYVMSPEDVQAYGKDFFDAINQGRLPKNVTKFASGGMVGESEIENLLKQHFLGKRRAILDEDQKRVIELDIKIAEGRQQSLRSDLQELKEDLESIEEGTEGWQESQTKLNFEIEATSIEIDKLTKSTQALLREKEKIEATPFRAFQMGLEDAFEDVDTLEGNLYRLGTEIPEQIADGWTRMWMDFIDGSESGTKAVEKFFMNFIKWAAQAMIKMVAMQQLEAIFGHFFPKAEGTPAQGKAEGGTIQGSSPHPKADNIPLWGTAGEYVMPVKAVKAYGTGFMDMIRNLQIPKFADGGMIGKSAVTPASGSGGINFMVNVENSVPNAEVEVRTPRFDGVRWVADMFVTAATNNVNGLGDIIRQGRR